MQAAEFFQHGWCRFPFDQDLADWAGQSLSAARNTVDAPENDEWLRCGGTWSVGVNALPNDENGAVEPGPPLQGPAVEFIRQTLGIERIPWERGQVSVCRPGYPKPMARESAAAFRFRRDRDAAHIDGLLPEGPDRRRHLRERHAFILGIPMVEFSPDASPFVIWAGSHALVRKTLIERFGDLPAESWGDVDVTETYHALRREIFETCDRVVVAARPGECYVVHRMSLHGIAPWGDSASATDDGRMICYFRPEFGDPRDWLRNP